MEVKFHHNVNWRKPNEIKYQKSLKYSDNNIGFDQKKRKSNLRSSSLDENQLFKNRMVDFDKNFIFKPIKFKNNFIEIRASSLPNEYYSGKKMDMIYDPILNCKSAGIIPYTMHDGKLKFLFQKLITPINKKMLGWNDFGGKRSKSDFSTIEAATREFSEETSCLFYLAENESPQNKKKYNLLKENIDLTYSDETIIILKDLIPISQKYYASKINEYPIPIHASSKEVYITYFIKVPYIPENEIPRAEDIHVSYQERYIRECKWVEYQEIINSENNFFHKRLQITGIKQQIINCYDKKLFN